MQSHLDRWGDQLAVRIPEDLAHAADLHEGEQVEISTEGGEIKIRALSKAQRLAALVEQITPENTHSEIDWGAPVGNEVW